MMCSSLYSSEFDRSFAEGESVIDALGLSAARRPRLEQRRINVADASVSTASCRARAA
jgi:hypothetical protein